MRKSDIKDQRRHGLNVLATSQPKNLIQKTGPMVCYG